MVAPALGAAPAPAADRVLGVVRVGRPRGPPRAEHLVRNRERIANKEPSTRAQRPWMHESRYRNREIPMLFIRAESGFAFIPSNSAAPPLPDTFPLVRCSAL